MKSTAIEIGRLLRAGTTGFVVGCRVNQLDSPSFGALASVPLENGYAIYGLIYDIHIDDDGLVRQLVTADGVDENMIADNRTTATCPVEMSVLAIGYRQAGRICHLLPPRPPLSLDVIYLCDLGRTVRILPAPAASAISATSCAPAEPAGRRAAGGAPAAGARGPLHQRRRRLDQAATQELITLLRDDYGTLMDVLGAVRDAVPVLK